MASSSSSHLGWWVVLLGALLGGIAWLASFIIGSASAQQEPLLVVYLIAWVGTLGGLVGLYARQPRSYIWLGTTSFFASFIGAILALTGTVLTLLSRGNLVHQDFQDRALGLGLFITLIGLVLFSVGFALLGVASLLGRAMPLWCGVTIILAPLVYWLLGAYGGIVLGLAWLAVSYALWLAREEALQQTNH
ncbi:MAG TPA: hypothetical protein VE288_11715 [Rubrobacteraceae bacterium]|jgi:hypothetical protein|nr:hypothetical protein [Rubrobacteraceae bacterium]